MTLKSEHLRAAISRRYPVVVAAVVLAVAGALAAGIVRPTEYRSTVILVVPSGGVPGAASEADNLAATYAVLIPEDQKVQLSAGLAAGMVSTEAGQAISVTVLSGSAILTVRFTANSAAKAYLGAQAVASAITGPHPVTRAIPAGSLVLVAKAQPATSLASSPLKTALLGGLLGALLGLVLAIAWERADPRIDDLNDLNELIAAPCSSGELVPAAAASLVQDWVLAGGAYMRVGLLIVGQPDAGALVSFRRSLEAAGDQRVELSELDFAAVGSQNLIGRYKPIVALVAVGTRRDSLVTKVSQLSELGGRLSWALLVPAAAGARWLKPPPGSETPPMATGSSPPSKSADPASLSSSVQPQSRRSRPSRTSALDSQPSGLEAPPAPTARPR
jgi:capsular polysaccharide biosynthesis protein